MVRINNTGIDSLDTGSISSVGKVASEGRSQAAGTALKSDSVSLSSATNLVALAKSSAASRQSKIQSLGAEIKSGRYQADTTQVSQAVVESHIAV